MSIPNDHPVNELPKPKPEYEPEEIIRMQVDALSDNDDPHEDAGIETAYNFASPGNRVSTGPLPRFRRMVKNRMYSAMIDHVSATYDELQQRGETAMQDVILETPDGEEVTYTFRVSKQQNGQWRDCWMTDSVVRE